MMQQNLLPYSKYELYQNYLHELNGMKFTMREIDIISCIISNRGNKKIASLLDIANKTVDSHVYNVISKINKNSREDIIDFVETSSKLLLVKKYYSCLRIEAAFNKKLSYIAKTINKNGIAYIISDTNMFISYEANNIITKRLQQLQKDLKLANVDLKLHGSQPVHFYIIKPNNSEQTTSNEIGLLVDIVVNRPVPPKIEYIDFTTNQNYYLATFNLLQKIINKPQLGAIKEEFQKEYDAIINNIESAEEQLQPECDSDKKEKQLGFKTASIYSTKSAKLIITLLICCFLVATILIFKTYNISTSKVTHVTTQDLNQVIKQLISAGFTASNVTTEQITKNHDLIKQVENMIAESKDSHYFNVAISSNDISSYLFIIHSISSYYLFHEEVGKANELLDYGKNVIEQYINSRNKQNLDFSKFQSSELYQELAIIKDFPQIYTKIIYMLGRANMFLGNTDKALYYFQIAKDLGIKLKLFEGYLSIRSGLSTIQGNKAVQEIQFNNHKAIETRLIEVVKLYKLLKDEDKSYILNYQSSEVEHKTIIPNKDAFNQLVCTRRMLYYLVFLLEITDHQNQEKYSQEIFDQLIGNNNTKGLVELVNSVSNKESAKTYNIIGNLLLKLYDNNIKFDLFKKAMTERGHLSASDELDIIKQVFDIAKEKSRSMEPNKADSYDGLAQVYVRKLKQNNSQKVKNELNAKITDLRKKRDTINKTLNPNLQTNPFSLKE